MGRFKTFVRDEVLDAATQLFWEKGFADTSLSDLEKVTGVNKSGLYSEFKDKNDIFVECLKRYQTVHPGIEILNMQPLGFQNIENFIKANMTCKGRKGCFMSNSLRESAIIPQKAKHLILDNSKLVLESLIKNLKAAGLKKNIETKGQLIMTFSAGLSLKLNVLKPEEVAHEVEEFLSLLKNL